MKYIEKKRNKTTKFKCVQFVSVEMKKFQGSSTDWNAFFVLDFQGER